MRYTDSCWRTAASCAAALMLAACGGGSDDGPAPVGDVRAEALSGKPVISAQPADATVVAGQSAQFRVVMAGYGHYYQWYRNGRVIAGATKDTYVTPKARAADDGVRYSVVVRSTGGTEKSRSAELNVSARSSLLAGRTWTKGDPVESGDESVVSFRSGIDDAGRLTALFVKHDGVRNVVYAAHGAPGGRGESPTWREPVMIDMLKDGTALGPASNRIDELSLAMAPNGNAFAVWIHRTACDADAYYTSATSDCDYVYGARYLASTRKWEAAVPFGSTPYRDRLVARINDAGDVAVHYNGWQRSATSSYVTRAAAVAWRANGGGTIARQVFPALYQYGESGLGLDRAGVMTLAGRADQGGTRDIVAYRGRVTSPRFGGQTVLDLRGKEAKFSLLAVGVRGQVAVSWTQDNGREDTRYVAVRPASGGAWRVADIGPAFASGSSAATLRATDAGEVVWQDLERCVYRRWSKNRWSAAYSMPPECARSSLGRVAANRNADFIALDHGYSSAGAFASYVADRNTMSRTFAASGKGSGYLFGTVTRVALTFPSEYELHLARNGIGAIVLRAELDKLPTAREPNGDGRNLHNLWGVYLK